MDKRNIRFITLKTFYSLFVGNMLADDEESAIEKAKTNIHFANCLLHENEVEKFFEKNPDVEREPFMKFLADVDGLKLAKTKQQQRETFRLNTPEAAKIRGVADENVNSYVELTTTIHNAIISLRQIMPKGWRATFSIINVEKQSEDTVSA